MSLTHRWSQGWSDPSAPAITWRGQTVTYGQLQTRLARAISWLRERGIGAGSTVALQLPKELGFLELHLAALALGAITLPLNPDYTESESRWILEDANADLHVRPGPLRAQLDACPAADWPALVDPEEIGVLCYTSGTTGKPKGALIRQRNIDAMVVSLHQAWRWSSTDVLVHALPLFHIHGLFVAQLGALHAGAHAVWLDRFDPDAVVEAIERHRASIFMGVPTFYHRLLANRPDPARLSSIRLFTSGSAALPARDWTAWRDRTGHEIVERYGMTEIGIAISNPLDGPRKPGSIGIPLPGVEARLSDGGELEVRSNAVFAGYHGRPDATAAALVDDWMRTGDLATRDSDGWLRLVGRKTEVIIRGGLNVYPAEVEALILALPCVAEVAVFGVPDPDLGERVHAAVVWADERAPLEDLRDALRDQLAPFKQPHTIHTVVSLPRNAMGKVLRGALRSRFASG